MYFEVEILFGGERAPEIARYSCETLDIYLARDVILRDFLDADYCEPRFVHEVIVYDFPNGERVRHPYLDLDMEEYSTSFLYQTTYFRELMNKSKINFFGVEEQIY